MSHLMTQNYAKLVIIFTQIQHAREYENISSWQHKSILDCIVDYSNCPDLIINLPDIFVSLQDSIRNFHNPLICLIIVRNNGWPQILQKILKLNPGYFLSLVR